MPDDDDRSYGLVPDSLVPDGNPWGVITPAPRQAGKTTINSTANLHQPTSRSTGGGTGPLTPVELDKLDLLDNGDVLRWVARGRGPNNRNIEYTYACVRAGGNWYITGAGAWYGTNTLTSNQIREVLSREEVIHVEWCESFLSASLW